MKNFVYMVFLLANPIDLMSLKRTAARIKNKKLGKVLRPTSITISLIYSDCVAPCGRSYVNEKLKGESDYISIS
jgi:hypothetical protein